MATVHKRTRPSSIERRIDGWRFGTRRIADHVVDRLINSSRAIRDGNTVRIVDMGETS